MASQLREREYHFRKRVFTTIPVQNLVRLTSKTQKFRTGGGKHPIPRPPVLQRDKSPVLIGLRNKKLFILGTSSFLTAKLFEAIFLV